MLKLGSVLLYGLQKKAFPSLKRYSGTKARPSCSTGLPDRLLSLLGQVTRPGLRQRERSLPPARPAVSAGSFQKLYPENWRQGKDALKHGRSILNCCWALGTLSSGLSGHPQGGHVYAVWPEPGSPCGVRPRTVLALPACTPTGAPLFGQHTSQGNQSSLR